MSEVYRIQWDIIQTKNETNEKVSSEIILCEKGVLEALDKVASKYGAEAKEVFFKLRHSFKLHNFFPWAYICTAEDYPVYHHLNALRGDPGDFLLSSYSVISHGRDLTDFSPPVGMVFFHDRDVFKKCAEKSLLLKLAWDDLEPYSRFGCWLLLMDPLPEDWVKAHRD